MLKKLRAPLFFVRAAEKIVRTHLIVVTQNQQMMDGKLVRSALVSRVHGLRRAENVRNFLLRFVMILSEIPHSFYIFQIAHLRPADAPHS